MHHEASHIISIIASLLALGFVAAIVFVLAKNPAVVTGLASSTGRTYTNALALVTGQASAVR